jgi:hypothetical protein
MLEDDVAGTGAEMDPTMTVAFPLKPTGIPEARILLTRNTPLFHPLRGAGIAIGIDLKSTDRRIRPVANKGSAAREKTTKSVPHLSLPLWDATEFFGYELATNL